MYIYTGRIDKTHSDQIHKSQFSELVDIFECHDYIFTFEDKTKGGLKCKPHYHFYIETKAKADTIRRYITKIGYPGALASLKKDVVDKEKAQIYILKQQNVVYTDIPDEIMDELLNSSKNYQEEIKVNTFNDHMMLLLDKLIIKYEGQIDPPISLMYDAIIEYCIDHNSEFQFPCKNTINSFLAKFVIRLSKRETALNYLKEKYK